MFGIQIHLQARPKQLIPNQHPSTSSLWGSFSFLNFSMELLIIQIMKNDTKQMY